jgi:hypothetical protein
MIRFLYILPLSFLMVGCTGGVLNPGVTADGGTIISTGLRYTDPLGWSVVYQPSTVSLLGRSNTSQGSRVVFEALSNEMLTFTNLKFNPGSAYEASFLQNLSQSCVVVETPYGSRYDCADGFYWHISGAYLVHGVVTANQGSEYRDALLSIVDSFIPNFTYPSQAGARAVDE